MRIHKVKTTKSKICLVRIMNGLDFELKQKAALKYDHQFEKEVRVWIQEVTGSVVNSFHIDIKDGVILW
jgi:hypothetical protein